MMSRRSVAMKHRPVMRRARVANLAFGWKWPDISISFAVFFRGKTPAS